MTDSLTAPDGRTWKLEAPKPAPDIPDLGFVFARSGYLAPADDASAVAIVVKEGSDRLQLLPDFPVLTADSFKGMPLLLKTKGKTTTDHISPAGPWLKYRGHLDRISDNMFTGAINAFDGGRGTTRNPLTGEKGQPTPAVARALKSGGKRWVVVGDENYGEGSSREHAAMSPRFLGAGAIIVRSFARIHETNLKKQGLLPLTFANAADYEKVREDDTVTVEGTETLAPKSQVTAIFHHADGSEDRAELKHTLNAEQVDWWKAGSALSLLRRNRGN